MNSLAIKRYWQHYRDSIIISMNCFLEWFDFSIYMFMAPILAKIFFPGFSASKSLMLTFAVFTSGYLSRPLGGLILGHMSDKHGRKYALNVAVFCMFISAIAISCLPTVWIGSKLAYGIIFLSRLLQGFSIGGEFTAVLVMLNELFKHKTPGFYMSLSGFFSSLAVSASALFIALLTAIFSQSELKLWVWRLPFIFMAITCLLQLVWLRNVSETPHYQRNKQKNTLLKHPLSHAISQYFPQLITIHLLTGFLGIVYYFYFTYLPVFLQKQAGLSQKNSLFVVSIASLFYTFASLLGGILVDRYGTKLILLAGLSIMTLLTWPFLSIMHGQLSYLLTCIMATIISVTTIAFYMQITDCLPSNCRSSGLSFSYNVAQMLWSSTCPLLATYFYQIRHNFNLFILYTITFGIVTIVNLVLAFRQDTAYSKPKFT